MATSQKQDARPATIARVIHAAMVSACVVFGLVLYFVVRPQKGDFFAPPVLYVLMGMSLAAMALAFLVLRGRVPEKSTNESADLYWTRASTPALITWAALEGGALLALVTYMLGGSVIALALAALVVVGLIALNPGTIERS